MQKPSPEAALQSQSNDTRFPEVPVFVTRFPHSRKLEGRDKQKARNIYPATKFKV